MSINELLIKSLKQGHIKGSFAIIAEQLGSKNVVGGWNGGSPMVSVPLVVAGYAVRIFDRLTAGSCV